MSDDPKKLSDDDLTNIVRQHGARTPATDRVEKAVLEQIRELEQKKAFDKKFEQSRRKESPENDGPEM